MSWIDNVEFTPITNAVAPDGDLPYATHEGVFDMAGVRLRCYRLNTGQAIVNADDVMRWLDGASKEAS